MAHTASRIERPAFIALTGGNGCKNRQRCGIRPQRLMTYEANGVAEAGRGRKSA